MVALKFDPTDVTQEEPKFIFSVIKNDNDIGTRSVLLMLNVQDGSLKEARYFGQETGNGSTNTHFSIMKNSGIIYIGSNF